MSQGIFFLPDVGEGLIEAEIVTWKVNVGDVVVLNQPLVDVETAKAVVELPSPFAGTVVTLHGEVGDTMEVDTPLVTFEVGVFDLFLANYLLVEAVGELFFIKYFFSCVIGSHKFLSK